MKVKVGAATVAIERGDITDRDVDAIVNAANTTLAMGAGVAGAIKRKGGVIIEEEAMRQGPIEVGEAVLTPGGNLAATHVIHAAVMGPDHRSSPDLVRRATLSSLRRAEELRLHSVAFPAFVPLVAVAPTTAVVCSSVAAGAGFYVLPTTVV